MGTTCQFFLKRPVLLINFSVAFVTVLFVTTVNSELPCNKTLVNSLDDKRIMSTSADWETSSRRNLRRKEKRGQCRRKCPLSSIPVWYKQVGLAHWKLCLYL